MLFTNTNFILLQILTIGNIVWGTELVPVYIWGTNKINERSHALHRTSEDSFKDTILEHLTKDPHVIVFVENTLSPEDFAQHNVNGESAFPHLQNFKKLAVYKPYVQNPIQAIKQLDKETTEMSIATYLNEKPNVPKDNVLIIYLNDAKEDEHRFDMLKRHDSFISSVYNDALEHYDNILAFYTAHHTSWVAPGEVLKPKKRSLLAEDPVPSNQTQKLYKSTYGFLYLRDLGRYIGSGDTNITLEDYVATSDQTVNGPISNITMTLKSTDTKPSFQFDFVLYGTGYWYLEKVTVQENNKNDEISSDVEVVAPNKFSYHCGGDVTFKNNDSSLILPGFQIQPFFMNITTNETKFGDAYDCVGFTSIPIWSGLFVTIILLIIMTFGLSMIMDIKTMDRFDDAKGKTITINVSE